MSTPLNLKTWIEIKQKSIEHNYRVFRLILAAKTKLWAVVKSNAYGHNFLEFARITDKFGVNGFCVDSCIEGMKLRENKIKKPILILGATLPQFFKDAKNKDLAITVSNFDILNALAKSKHQPKFHIKVDTGMHRQGFYPDDLPKAIKIIRNRKSGIGNSLAGIYTHFCAAKDLTYPAYTEGQFKKFQKTLLLFEKAGFKELTRHAAATGGTLMNQKYHLDAVRVGIGLYGLWPSKELQTQRGDVHLKPVLSWHTVVSEVKDLKKGDFVGYDLTERMTRPAKMAVLPIGYWHGLPRNLSAIAEVLINGKRARILGRISMDLTVVDVTGIKCKPGDKATIIGRQKNEEITAYELALKAGTSHYEIVTRLNPLIKRIFV